MRDREAFRNRQAEFYYTAILDAIDASKTSGKPVLVVDPVLGDTNFHTIFFNGQTPEGFDKVVIGGEMTHNPTSFVAAPGAKPPGSSE